MTAGSLSPVCADAASSVTALLPATTAPPDPARRIGFLRAVLLFWLLPKRFGPHLAVGSFKACLAAHALSLLLPLVILYLLFGVPWPSSPSDVPTPNEPPATFRENLARIVLREAIDSAQGRAGPSWVPSVLTFGSIPMFELLILMIGTAAMPFAAGGDPAFSVWKRSVKNAYWCTTILMPLSLAASGLLYFDRRVPDIFRVDLPTALPKIGAYLLAALLAVLLVRAIVVGAHRYVGPANGPAFAPREPRCDDCGYLIFSLPLDARCPECGLPVRDSLPGGRRGALRSLERVCESPPAFPKTLSAPRSV